ncbi:hypothetical protein INT44_003701 [Umbelopsis vinacea]|uniref:Uncharacterized protein n=1 Tax=Umbelopsis vinacea TaxID=44442 RepID=A0A8H7PWD1_9FUNG|nr:hypothetical protein INT44_003701 [Umbelopsis vinacea]
MIQSSFDFLLLSLLSIPFSYVNYLFLIESIKPLTPLIQQACRRLQDLSSLDIRYTYSLIAKLNSFPCSVTKLYEEVFKDAFGSVLMASLLGATTTAVAVLSVEAGRKHAYRIQALVVPIILLSGNTIGISVILPLVWIPLNGITQYMNRYKNSSYHNYIHPFRVLAIMAAVIFGQILVSALPFMAKTPSQFRTALTILQLGPIMYSTIEWVCTFLSRSSCFAHDNQQQITRADAMQSKIFVQQLYMTLTVTNLILHYGIIANVFLQELNVVQVLASMLRAQPWMTADSTGLNAATLYICINLIALVCTFAYWAALDGGLDGLILYGLSCLVLGPGAGLAAYCWVREQSKHDQYSLGKI